MWNGSTDPSSTTHRQTTGGLAFGAVAALQGLADRYDPHRLPNPDISERHEDYLMYRLPPLPTEKWALDSRFSRGVWGAHLGPNCNRLFGHIAAALTDVESESLNIRSTAAALRITPARLHAEIDLLHRHGLIDFEHDRGSIATSGYVAAPPRQLSMATHLSPSHTAALPARNAASSTRQNSR